MLDLEYLLVLEMVHTAIWKEDSAGAESSRGRRPATLSAEAPATEALYGLFHFTLSGAARLRALTLRAYLGKLSRPHLGPLA